MSKRKVCELDGHIGARLRSLRVAAGLSQEAGAAGIGVTFQQLQKYEKGQNRVSVSTLFALCAVLTVSVSSFLAPLEDGGERRRDAPAELHSAAALALAARIDMLGGAQAHAVHKIVEHLLSLQPVRKMPAMALPEIDILELADALG